MLRRCRTLVPALALALLLPVGSVAHGLDRAPPRSAAPGTSVYSLPKDTTPAHLAVAADGAVWISNRDGGITRLSASGATQELLKRDEVIDEVAAGGDGTIWVTGPQVEQIAGSGEVLRRLENDSPNVLASAGDALWMGYEGDSETQARIARVSADGTSREFALPAPRLKYGFGFHGIAAAPDGAAWFTESDLRRGWIGRMTADGRYAYWPLPRAVGDPGRIAAGTDGAMWFTGKHVIVRVASSGQMTRFLLGGHAAPHDIVTGRDGAVWFTSDVCVGRITGAGAVTTWPVPGALKLEGIAAAADGSFWLADQIGNVIVHLDPAAAAAAPCGAPTLTRASSPTTATVSFHRYYRVGDVDFFDDIHVSIARNGEELFRDGVPGLQGSRAVSDSHGLTVRDLDGDGEPEVMLLLNWSGTQCCSWSRIYHYDRARDTYIVHRHFWGYFGADPVLRDLDADRRPELVSANSDFFERFGHESPLPVQIWSYRHGRLRDVTRRYPRLIRRDAATLWRFYLQYRKTAARSILPAWMADEYLLGRQAFADRVLAQAGERGELKHPFGYGPRGVQAYIRAVKTFLRDGGYRR